MTKKLEELFDLPENQDIVKADAEATDKKDKEEQRRKQLEKAEEAESLSTTVDKIASAMPRVSGLGAKADRELDEIADRALESFEELMTLGKNTDPSRSGRIFEVAGGMLKTSLDAKVAKMDKKIKTLDLQLKKQKLDQNQPDTNNAINGDELVLDRTQLLAAIQKSNTDDKDK